MEVAEAEWGRKGTKGKRAIYIDEVGGLANFDKEVKGAIQDMQTARREGLLQGAWEQWQQSRGGEGGRSSEMKTVKGGDAGKGTSCTQQTDRQRGDKLRKLQAVQRLRQILTGDSFLEGEGSSQGSETESEQKEGARRMEGRQVKVSYQQKKKGKRDLGKCEGVLRLDGAFVEVCDSTCSGRVVDRKQLTEMEVVGMEYMEKGDGIEVGGVQVTLRKGWWMEESGSDEEW